MACLFICVFLKGFLLDQPTNSVNIPSGSPSVFISSSAFRKFATEYILFPLQTGSLLQGSLVSPASSLHVKIMQKYVFSCHRLCVECQMLPPLGPEKRYECFCQFYLCFPSKREARDSRLRRVVSWQKMITIYLFSWRGVYSWSWIVSHCRGTQTAPAPMLLVSCTINTY